VSPQHRQTTPVSRAPHLGRLVTRPTRDQLVVSRHTNAVDVLVVRLARPPHREREFALALGQIPQLDCRVHAPTYQEVKAAVGKGERADVLGVASAFGHALALNAGAALGQLPEPDCAVFGA